MTIMCERPSHIISFLMLNGFTAKPKASKPVCPEIMMSLYDLMAGNSMTAQKPDLGKPKPGIKMMANFGTKLPLAGAVTLFRKG